MQYKHQLSCPGRSPERAGSKVGVAPAAPATLWDGLQDWGHGLNDLINKLYESLLNRMDAVLQAHGSHTRY